MEDRLFTLEKLWRRMRELEHYRFCDMKDLSPMAAMDDACDPDAVHNAVPELVEGFELSTGDDFRGRDRYVWVRATVDVPPAAPERLPFGLFDFGSTGGGGNSGFEAMLFVDRVPFSGVDSNHTEIDLSAFAGKRVELTLMLWSGLEGGGQPREQEHRVYRAHVGYLHTPTDALYYDMKAGVKTAKLLADDDPNRYVLIRALESAAGCLNWDKDKLHATVPAARDALAAGLAGADKHSEITVRCIGHTHIDVAWLWRLKHTREKAIRSFSTVLHLMEQFDEYVFLQSQPQLYQYIKHDMPELYAQMKERVAQGKWEADGGMWLEADCNVTSGESLTRQLLYGIRFLEQEFGHTCSYLWLPDVFGYSWALPQILKQSGLNTFVTSKISWNQYNTMPDDLFTWRGIDGSEIMTYFLTVPGMDASYEERFSTYNGMLSPHSVIGTWKKFRNKALTNEVLLTYGFGDGGGGVNRNMLMMRRAMERIPGLPNAKPGRVGEYLDRVHQDIQGKENEMHVWDGELYLEYHRGTYTTQARNKRSNRKLEFALTLTEWLASQAALDGVPYDRASIVEAWQTLLRNQFHDIIPGSSIAEVYRDSTIEYAQANAQLEEVRGKALAALVEDASDCWTAYHFGSFARRDCVFFASQVDGRFEMNGESLAAQRVEGGYLVSIEMPALSMKTVRFLPGAFAQERSPFTIDLQSRSITTPHYRIHWNELGQIDRLFDLEAQRDTLGEGGLGNALQVFEDKPISYDAWDIDLFYSQKWEHARLCAPVTLVTEGPLQATLRFTFRYNASTITQDMVVYRDSRRIDFETRVDWHEKCRLLKASFDTSVRSTKASYDVQYGHVERPTHNNTSWDWARFEVAGQKWADLSEGNYGVALLNDCKYGYSINGATIKLSLLKSSTHPDPQADMGEHVFTYSLLPHSGTVITSEVIQEADALNLPVQVMAGRVRKERRLVWVDCPAIHVDAVKMAEDGDMLVVRTHECRGGTHRARLSSDMAVASVTPCNLLEKPSGDAFAIDAELTWKPFEIKTFLFTLKN